MVNKDVIKKEAKEFAFRNKKQIFLALLFVIVVCYVSLVVSTMFMGAVGIIVNLLLFFLSSVIIIGTCTYIFDLMNNRPSKLFSDIGNTFFKIPAIVMALLICIIATILWSVFLIVPGIVYAISVSFVFFILAESNKATVKWMEVVTESRKLLDGKKIDYVVFNLSLIGWYLLSATIIGAFWALPYIVVANMKYYQSLKQSNMNMISESEASS